MDDDAALVAEGFDPRAVTDLVLALASHHRRTAHLLSGLDDLRRSTEDATTTASSPDGACAALLAHFTHHLRSTDDRLGRLAGRLDGTGGRAAASG